MALPEDLPDLKKGAGCDYCLRTGYRGRTAVFEIFEVDEDVRKLILAQASANEIKRLAMEKGMKPLNVMGREAVLQGISTIEEIRRTIYTGKD